MPRYVPDYGRPRFPETFVARRRHPLTLQTTEEPLHRTVIPAVSAPTHALRYPVTPQYLSVLAYQYSDYPDRCGTLYLMAVHAAPTPSEALL